MKRTRLKRRPRVFGRVDRIRALGKGESFVVPLDQERATRTAATYFNVTQAERKVTVRKECGGVRVTRWR